MAEAAAMSCFPVLKKRFRNVSFPFIFFSLFSGQGGIPHRRYYGLCIRRARERFRMKRKVSRFGAKPKPTVRVRMKEDKNAAIAFLRPGSC